MLAATAAGLALTTVSSAQVLYDNGGYKTGTLTSGGTAAPAGNQWSEVQNNAGTTTQSNTTAGYADNHDNATGQFRLADDFTVPAGQIWNVNSVCLYDYKTLAAIPGTSPFDLYTLRIWNGPPGDLGAVVIFGDTSTNRLLTSMSDLAFRIFNTTVPAAAPANANTQRLVWKTDVSTLTAGNPLVLSGGSYWVDWSSSDTANGAHFSPPRTIVGTRGLPGWNARQFIGGTTNTWTPITDAGNPSPTTPDIPMDLLFQVKGAQGNNCLSPLPPCNGDVFPAGGDGTVNIDDLVQGVINNWGQTGPPRPMGDCFPLPNGDCTVNIDDLIQGVINNWGNCPAVTGRCCTNGVCSIDTQANCLAGGGIYLGNGGSCTPNPCPIPPANDNCASRIVVGNGTHNWNNANANTDGPTVPCTTPVSRDVWFNYTATCTGHVTFDTVGTLAPFTDTVLTVYSGNSCSPLGAVLGCNDDLSTSSFLSSVTIDLTQGQTVKVRCMSFGTTTSNSGPALLNIACVALNNDACSDAESISIGQTINGNVQGATQDTAPLCNGVATGIGRWYKVTGNGSTLRASTCNSPAESWEGRLSVYCDDTLGPCGNLTCVNASGTFDCGPGGSTQTGLHERVDWCSASGQAYYILVHTDALPLPPEGAYQLTVTDIGPTCTTSLVCGNPPPANDECAGAITVNNGVNTGNTTGSTSSTPNNLLAMCGSTANQFINNDAWYVYTATNTDPNWRFSMCTGTGATSDFSMQIFTGACGALTPVACDDDTCAAGGPSEITMPTTMGTVYRIRIGGWSAAAATAGFMGPFTLTIGPGTPPILPNCTAACTVTETEMCGTDANGGCNSTPVVYQAVTTGTTVCGEAWANTPTAGTRDTDWYFLTVGASGRVEAHIQGTASAAYNVATLIVGGVSPNGMPPIPPCPGATVLQAATSVNNACVVAVAQGLAPGTPIVVFAGAVNADGTFPTPVFACGTTASYKITILSP